MYSIKNSFNQFVSKSLTDLIGILFADSAIRNPGKGKKISAPDKFSPVLRFAVCSDIHLDGDENGMNAKRLNQMFEDLYSYSSASAYNKLDAVLIAGDFTGKGDTDEYKMFNSIVSHCIREETELLSVLGNHEFIKYRDEDATVGYKIYKEYINEDVDTHKVINGYHFIGVSYNDDGRKFSDKTDWLRKELDTAKADSVHKPIFVFQHPHPFATVYGSINWGDTTIKKVLSDYPQVIDFSGHSHYSPSDPRSVWQGSFTAVGCGSLAAFMGNLNYIDGDKDAPGNSGGYWIVEVDEKGNTLLRLFDAENRCFFDNVNYYFSDISDVSSRNYCWHRQRSLDTKPVFPENAEISYDRDKDGNIILKFPDAAGFYEAENYKIIIKSSDGRLVFAETVISDYVRSGHKGVTVNISKKLYGSHIIQINTYSPYAKKGGKLYNTLDFK